VATDKVPCRRTCSDDHQPHHRQRSRRHRRHQPPPPRSSPRAAWRSASASKAGGATVIGVKGPRPSPPNGRPGRTARPGARRDMHDTFLAAELLHPRRQHPPVLAGRQAMG
jgi:hypothetical protein